MALQKMKKMKDVKMKKMKMKKMKKMKDVKMKKMKDVFLNEECSILTAPLPAYLTGPQFELVNRLFEGTAKPSETDGKSEQLEKEMLLFVSREDLYHRIHMLHCLSDQEVVRRLGAVWSKYLEEFPILQAHMYCAQHGAGANKTGKGKCCCSARPMCLAEFLWQCACDWSGCVLKRSQIGSSRAELQKNTGLMEETMKQEQEPAGAEKPPFFEPPTKKARKRMCAQAVSDRIEQSRVAEEDGADGRENEAGAETSRSTETTFL